MPINTPDDMIHVPDYDEVLAQKDFPKEQCLVCGVNYPLVTNQLKRDT